MRRTAPGRGLTLMLAALLAGCQQAATDRDSPIDAVLLEYSEQEAGSAAYPVRILVTDHYLRIDDGYDESDYILLDRDAASLFSVTHGDRSILRIVPPATDAGPVADIEPGIEHIVDESAPLIAGRRPQHYRFTAAGAVCREAVVVPELLPAAIAALEEYDRLLARRQIETLEQVPAEIRTPCYLSRYVYYPARPLEHGLPIREWDASGYLRVLTDYRERLPVPRTLFTLPIGYQEYTLTP